ncbi:sugar phosphate isomerase/epimerase family protein [Afifella sp. YEN Y35]|uniref:sugar phosphate isomerase/epimerase family protein n=1 Tax=Afifella sp. YEN Y35 TaxID=3388337 RepID=UPI0039E03343
MARLAAGQLCGMNFHYFRHSFARFLDDVAEAGLTRVELWGAQPHFYLGDPWLQSARKIRDDLRVRELELVCFTPEQCVYPINIAAEEAVIRERSLRYFLESLSACVELESPYLLVTPGWGYADQDAAEAWKRSADGLSLLCRHAERLGITLLLEPLTRAESNVINTSADLARMIAELRSPAVKAILDTAAMVAAGETIGDYLGRFGPDLAHVHFIDGDDAGAHLAWGDGSYPLRTFLAELQSGGYAGSLSFEFTSSQYWLDPLPPMRDSAALIRGELQKL